MYNSAAQLLGKIEKCIKTFILQCNIKNVNCDVNFELHLSQNLLLPQKSSVKMEVLTPVKNDESL